MTCCDAGYPGGDGLCWKSGDEVGMWLHVTCFTFDEMSVFKADPATPPTGTRFSAHGGELGVAASPRILNSKI